MRVTPPRVSVVLTCFNREKSLAAAVESVLKQDFWNFQLLLVDDASTDSSLRVARNFGDPRLVIIARERNGGQNAALNTGLMHAEGDFVAFLDSDDEYCPTFLSEMVATLDALDSSVAMAYCRFVGGPAWDLSGADCYRQALVQGFVSGLGTMVLRREALLQLLPLPEKPEIGDMCQDDRLSLEVARRFGIVHIDRELYRVGTSANSVTRNKVWVAQGRDILVHDYKEDILRLSGQAAWVRHLVRVYIWYVRAGNREGASSTAREILSSCRGLRKWSIVARVAAEVLVEQSLRRLSRQIGWKGLF